MQGDTKMAKPLAPSVTGGREASGRVRDVRRARRGLRAREQPHRAADLPSPKNANPLPRSRRREFLPRLCFREHLNQTHGLCCFEDPPHARFSIRRVLESARIMHPYPPGPAGAGGLGLQHP